MRVMTRLSLILLPFLLLIASCRSNKDTARARPEQHRASGEYSSLSRKLNLQVDKGDNIRLYSYVADWLGTRHKLGGCDRSGIDCSCFVRMLSQEVYHTNLARTAEEMYRQVKQVSKNDLREGDLVFFSIGSAKPSHVGIYLKKGWFAHVSSVRGVMINNLSEAYYTKHFTAAGRGG